MKRHKEVGRGIIDSKEEKEGGGHKRIERGRREMRSLRAER